jgi:hypothetical protein
VQGRSHPQLAVEIARKARDTIQGLDSRFRGKDVSSFKGDADVTY